MVRTRKIMTRKSRRQNINRKSQRQNINRKSRRQNKRNSKKMRIGGSGSGKKVVVKSLPNEKKSKLENEINDFDYSIIKFYMNGCPHCDDIKEMWKNVGKDSELESFCRENNCKLGIFEVEVREYSDPIDEKYIGKDQGVPHIICVNKKTGEINTFNDERKVENVKEFVKKNIKGNKTK
jgi:hypothetical protein